MPPTVYYRCSDPPQCQSLILRSGSSFLAQLLTAVGPDGSAPGSGTDLIFEPLKQWAGAIREGKKPFWQIRLHLNALLKRQKVLIIARRFEENAKQPLFLLPACSGKPVGPRVAQSRVPVCQRSPDQDYPAPRGNGQAIFHIRERHRQLIQGKVYKYRRGKKALALEWRGNWFVSREFVSNLQQKK